MALFFLASHLRYRRQVLEALARAESGGVELADLEILAVETGIKAPLSLLCLCAETSLAPFREALAAQLRRGDRILPLRDGRLVLLLRCEPTQLRAILGRVLPWLEQKAGCAVRAIAWRDFGDLSVDPDQLPPPPELPAPDFSPLPGQEHLLDPLTGVLHPSRVVHAFRKLLAQERLHNRPLCILRVDVDGMGDINRHLGRETGDALLQGVARRLMRHCRESDLIGRLGDDEFLICLPGVPEDILEAARRMAASLRAEPVAVPGSEVRCTVCIGLAGAPSHGQSPGALFEAAGLALSAAAGRGRGVCLAWEPSMRPRPASLPIPSAEGGPEAF